MEHELEALLKRARAVLARHDGPQLGCRHSGALGAGAVVARAEHIYYELGIASSEPGPAATISLRLEAPGATARTFRVAFYVEGPRIVLATRWHPTEKRPLLSRGDARGDAWTTGALEDALEARVTGGANAFEQALAKGSGHLDSSGDLLGLGG